MIYSLRNIEANKVNLHTLIDDEVVGTCHIKSDKFIKFVGAIGIEDATKTAEDFLSGKIKTLERDNDATPRI